MKARKGINPRFAGQGQQVTEKASKAATRVKGAAKKSKTAKT